MRVHASAPRVALTLLLGTLCVRCTSGSSDDGSPASGSVQPEPSNGTAGTSSGIGGSSSSGGSGGTGGTAPVVVPPEKELEQSFLAPVVNGGFIFSANPKSGRVAVIDAETYAVRLFNAGFGPKYLTGLPGDRGAIVINELSHDTTLFEFSGARVNVSDLSLPVHEGANAWAVSPDARFAIAWTRTEDEQNLDPTAGSQTITVLDLERREEVMLSVGFHPTQVVVDDESRRAFVVSDDGISVVTLGDSPEVSLLARVSEDPLEEPAARDVSILRDGSLAVVRVEGSSKLRIVSLERADDISFYDLGAPVADVDLSHDGRLAVAAVPGIGQLVLLPMPLGDETSFERVAVTGEIASSVALADAAELALLYQNGADNSHVTVLDLREGEKRALHTLDLKGPVNAVFAAPDAASAIAFQRPITGSKKAGSFSIVPTLAARSAKIIGTDAVPSAVAFDRGGSFALVTTGNEKSAVHGVYRIRLDTMQEDYIELSSPPASGATGIIDKVGRGFVAQTHPEGRITFIDMDTAQAHTITGFELAARILQ